MSFRRAFTPLLLAAAVAACTDNDPTSVSTRTPTDKSANYVPPAEPVSGEFIRQAGTLGVFLVHNNTLYGIPDEQTLRACTGGREKVVREVSSLPAWQQKTLPSAGSPTSRPHGRVWMFGDRPIKSSAGGAAYVLVGCVKSGIPTPTTYQAIYGDQNWDRIVTVPDADFQALPEGALAQQTPLRRAGTMVESGGWVKWVTSQNTALGVPTAETVNSYCRGWTELVTSSAEHAAYAQNGILQNGSGPGVGCFRGNEYHYRYHVFPTNNADVWNFIIRQCTSFVAWRLNQDGIEFHNAYRQPAGYTWSHAYKWDEAAVRAGLVMNKTPKVGAVAQWNTGQYGHVAYVAAVNNDGSVTIEEYNASPGSYSTKTLPADDVENYIHFR